MGSRSGTAPPRSPRSPGRIAVPSALPEGHAFTRAENNPHRPLPSGVPRGLIARDLDEGHPPSPPNPKKQQARMPREWPTLPPLQESGAPCLASETWVSRGGTAPPSPRSPGRIACPLRPPGRARVHACRKQPASLPSRAGSLAALSRGTSTREIRPPHPTRKQPPQPGTNTSRMANSSPCRNRVPHISLLRHGFHEAALKPPCGKLCQGGHVCARAPTPTSSTTYALKQSCRFTLLNLLY
jgi:hypothetical protein